MLHGGDYEDYIGKDKPIIVNFFSRFSAESQRGAAEWEKVVEKYMNEGSNVLVAMIDGWNYESITEIYGIDVLPVIMFFAAGSVAPIKFQGEMTAQNVIDFVEKVLPSGSADDAVVITDDGELNIVVQIDATNLTDENIVETADSLIVTDDNNELQIMIQIDASTLDQINNDEVVVVVPDNNDNNEVVIMVEIDASNIDDAGSVSENIDLMPNEEKVLDTINAEPVQEENKRVVEVQAETVSVLDESRKEVKVVLDTTLLQSQFQDVQGKADGIRANIEAAITDNSQQIEKLKEFINTQNNDMKDLYEEIRVIAQAVEEITEKMFLSKEEEEKSTMMPASRHLEEVKSVINEVKDKMFEDFIGGEKSTSRSMMFLFGVLGGAVLTYIIVSLGDRNSKRRTLYD